MQPDRSVRGIQTISRWLDDRYLDPILGLVLPGVGDAATSVFGLYVVITAARRKLPPVVLARMLLNLAIDGLVGAVPVLGDLFDVGFKAHKRNTALLLERLDQPAQQRQSKASDWLLVVGALLLLLAALSLPVLVLVWAIGGLWSQLS
ncbi:DUF4112 domain-containing protein [Haliangium ochraceum]|uniref:DUF4112 domain-containing protein n=1 Tax=Haliangium ochraceum (strain DSM 14365 / JCM 11303 / SMP-2) TaxID=502025 RepID=D0LTS3_HALO1|nr:DUF4112 domain-containing protein [Haliangium ochraceum]ACY15767.1 hypothetical protein Hoch_3265 [Haliangium ochraceum DSM 14365]